MLSPRPARIAPASDHPLPFVPALALELGLVECLTLLHLDRVTPLWKLSDYWIPISARQIQIQATPFVSTSKVQRALLNLVVQHKLLVEQPGAVRRFKVDYDAVALLTSVIVLPEPRSQADPAQVEALNEKLVNRVIADNLVDQLALVCRLDPEAKAYQGLLRRTAFDLYERGYIEEDVRQFGIWFNKHHWRGRAGMFPTLTDVVDGIQFVTSNTIQVNEEEEGYRLVRP